MASKRKVNRLITISMDAETRGLLEQMREATGLAASRIISDLVKESAQAMGLRVADSAARFRGEDHPPQEQRRL